MATRQHIFGKGDAPSNTTTNFINPLGGGNTSSLWTATEADRRQIVPAAGAFSNLYIQLTAAPGAGNSYAFTIRKNGVDTGIAVTISESDTSGSSAVSVNFAVDDEISLQCVPTSTPTAATPTWVLNYVSSEGNGVSIYGITGSHNTSSGSRSSAWGGYNFPTTSGGQQTGLVSSAGNLTKVRIKLTVEPGAGKSFLGVIYKTAVAQDGAGGTPDTQITIADSATTGNWAGTVISAITDNLQFRFTPTGTPAATTASVGFVFVNTTDGEWNIGGFSVDNITNSGTEYAPLATTASAWTTEAANGLIVGLQSFRLQNLRISAPGSITATMTVRKAGAGTGITCAIAGTSCSDFVNQQNYNTTGETFALEGAVSSAFNDSVAWGITGFDKASGGGAGKGNKGHKGGGGITVIQPGGALTFNIGNPGLSIGST